MPKLHFHPEYLEKEQDWIAYRDLFEGDHKVLSSSPKYLWPHELEYSTQQANLDPTTGIGETVGHKIRRVRALRSRYFNLFEPVISTWISMALSKPMNFSSELEELLGPEGMNDIDGNGTSLRNFIMGPLAAAYFRDGKAIVLVDAPKDAPETLRGVSSLNFRPTMEVLPVLSVKDWEGTHKDLKWLRWEFQEILPRAGGAEEEPQKVDYSKVLRLLPGGGVAVDLYTKDKESGDWVLESSVETMAGFSGLPVSMSYGNIPWVRDVAELQLVLYNLMSAHYNLLNTQAFQRVFIAGDLQDKHLISISEYAVSVLPAESKPHVIEPSSTEGLLKVIGNTMDQIYRVAFNRTRGVPMDSREAPGASTLREMSTELIALLVQSVYELEALINRALKHYAAFIWGPEKAADFAGGVTLSKDITAEDIAQQIQLFLAYKDEILSVESWKKAHLKKVAVSMGYNDTERAQILSDIDKMQEAKDMGMPGYSSMDSRVLGLLGKDSGGVRKG